MQPQESCQNDPINAMTDYKGQITMDMVKRELSVLLLMCKISTVALQSSIQALQKWKQIVHMIQLSPGLACTQQTAKCLGTRFTSTFTAKNANS